MCRMVASSFHCAECVVCASVGQHQKVKSILFFITGKPPTAASESKTRIVEQRAVLVNSAFDELLLKLSLQIVSLHLCGTQCHVGPALLHNFEPQPKWIESQIDYMVDVVSFDVIRHESQGQRMRCHGWVKVS